MRQGLRSAVVVSCIHYHTPAERPASAACHFPPLTIYSWQSASGLLFEDEKLLFSASHGT